MADHADSVITAPRAEPKAHLQTPPGLIDLCGGVTATAYLWLAVASKSPPVPLGTFFCVLALAWGALLLALARFSGGRTVIPMRRIVAWGLLFRLIGLAGAPVLEDDHYRYLWDGRSFALSGSPFLDAPADHFDDPSVPLAFRRILDRINYPNVPTIYAPVCQYLFLASYWILPGHLVPIKIGLLVADLATLYLLYLLLPPGGVLLYAWCPLVIKETAFTAHMDSLGVFFLVAAVYAYLKRKDRAVAACGALAVATRPLAILVVPLLLRRLRRSQLALFMMVLGLLYLPFLAHGLTTEGTGMRTFLFNWEFNSLGFAVLSGLGGRTIARLVAGVVVACVFIHEARRAGECDEGCDAARARRIIPRGDLLFGCCFLFAPVINPWYLLWLLPFVSSRPSAWGLAAMVGVSLSYVHGLYLPDSGLPPYHHPLWVRPAEAALVALAMVVSEWRGTRYPAGA